MGNIIEISRGLKMINLTYKQIRHPDFLMTTSRIYKSKMGIRSSKRVLEILKEIDKELQLANEVFLKLASEHMKDLGDGSFEALSGPEHTAAIAEYQNTPVEIQKQRITLQELFHVELSPMEVELLEGLIDVTG